jgi:hypothetical protein
LLDSVTTVLELAGGPLRVREAYAAVEESYGERVAVLICERGVVHPSERWRRTVPTLHYGTHDMARR